MCLTVSMSPRLCDKQNLEQGSVLHEPGSQQFSVIRVERSTTHSRWTYKILAARGPYDNTVISASHLPQAKANHATLAAALPFIWDSMT